MVLGCWQVSSLLFEVKDSGISWIHLQETGNKSTMYTGYCCGVSAKEPCVRVCVCACVRVYWVHVSVKHRQKLFSLWHHLHPHAHQDSPGSRLHPDANFRFCTDVMAIAVLLMR